MSHAQCQHAGRRASNTKSAGRLALIRAIIISIHDKRAGMAADFDSRRTWQVEKRRYGTPTYRRVSSTGASDGNRRDDFRQSLSLPS